MTSPFAKLAAQICGFDKNLEAGKCPFCGCDNPQDTIRDEHSMREFNISHLCQSCQDKTFVKED